MLPHAHQGKVKATNSARKELPRELGPEEKLLSFLNQGFSPNSETITVTVIPCGREDGKNAPEEMPFEMKIRKKGIYSRS